MVRCASNSEKALVLGKWLKAGAHIWIWLDPISRRRMDNEVAKMEVGELVGAFELMRCG